MKLPDYLLGRWESDTANCASEEPISGEGLFLERHNDGDTLAIVDWETESGVCDVVQVTGSSPDLTVLANCASEVNPKEATTVHIHMGPGQLSLGLSYSSAREKSGPPTDFHRCVAIGRAS